MRCYHQWHFCFIGGLVGMVMVVVVCGGGGGGGVAVVVEAV